MIRSVPRAAAVLACLAAAVAAVAGLATWCTLAPDEATRLRDDAFYEFVWAANLAAGHGPAVSDGTTTSGVQLAWSLLLAPFAGWFGAVALPAFAPWLGFALHVGTAGLWFAAQRDRVAGLCLGLCWLGHPLLLREAQNGQETALAALCASGLWWARRAGERGFAALAVGSVLVRTDLLLLVAVVSWLRHREAPLRALVVPLVAVVPLLVVDRVLGGGWLPDSALPMAWLWHANQAAADSSWAGAVAAQWWYARPALLGGPFALVSAFGCGWLVFRVVRPFWSARLRAVPPVAVASAAALGAHDLATPGWAALLLALFPASGRRPTVRTSMALLLVLALVIALHWAVRWYPRDYYLAPLVALPFAGIAAAARCRLVLLAFAIAQLVDLPRVVPEPLAGQRAMALAGRTLADVLDPAERVGCFNSGLVTFHADVLAEPGRRRGIVNLDGVVDARAFTALRKAELGAWLDEQRVRFVLDNPVEFARDPRLPHASGRYFGADFDAAKDLVEVARFELAPVDATAFPPRGMRLYWRRGRGAPPAAAAADAPSARWLAHLADGTDCIAWRARAGDTLVVERTDGGRDALCSADATTVVVLAVPPRLRGTGRLFVAGVEPAVLTLPARRE